MSFWNRIGKKVEEATQVATQKSTELVEVTKLNTAIKSKEREIERLYTEIGKKVYEGYSMGEFTEDFTGLCEQIDDYQAEIKQLKAKVLEIKNVKLCNSCGSEVSSSSTFCDQCGTRLEGN